MEANMFAYLRLITIENILYYTHAIQDEPMEANMFAYLRLITIENILYYKHAIQEDLWKRICSPTYDLLR